MTLSTEVRSGFVAPQVNSEGIVHPDPRREKRNGKGKVKQQRPVRQKYIFVTASKRGQRYRDYFNPNNAVQLRVMGMEDTLVSVTLPGWPHSTPVSPRGGLSPWPHLTSLCTVELRFEAHLSCTTGSPTTWENKPCCRETRRYVRG
jgi:hypothetical protein